jgi:DNA methylase
MDGVMDGMIGIDQAAAETYELGAAASLEQLRASALDVSPIDGFTHRFYRYPARFSPSFARAAIASFSKAGDLVLDPYMGGGTSIVEAMVAGRAAVGCDLNSLAVFVAGVKTTTLTLAEQRAMRRWADHVVPRLLYTSVLKEREIICERRTYNLTLPTARPIKKVLALALNTMSDLPSAAAVAFARCVLLNVGQWALNGKKTATSLREFRQRVTATTKEMLDDLQSFDRAVGADTVAAPLLFNDSAANLAQRAPFNQGVRVDLVVTSPPYPGIHMLYHRWQIDGRRESPAPYWLANCEDGKGEAFYNFADRRASADAYFAESLRTLHAIRAVMKRGGICVQLVAFSDPRQQLARYLRNMDVASFAEVRASRRIWRTVPGRRWHAASKGALSASREVVLVHRAV